MQFVLSLIVIAMLLMSVQVQAQKIYKWIDEDGRTHFGAQPPNLKDGQVVGHNAVEPVRESNNNGRKEHVVMAEDLNGHFVGLRNGQTVHIVFSKKGLFVESLEYKRDGYAVRNMRSYAGDWQLNKNQLKFHPTFTDHGSNFIGPPVTATVLGMHKGALRLIWEDEEAVFEKQYSGSSVAFPETMR